MKRGFFSFVTLEKGASLQAFILFLPGLFDSGKKITGFGNYTPGVPLFLSQSMILRAFFHSSRVDSTF